MTGFSQSALLQALGWATLNSFWQVGLLWCGYAWARSVFRFSAQRQYTMSVSALVLSFLLFWISFFLYYTGQVNAGFWMRRISTEGEAWLPLLLTAASVAYLLVLTIPAIRLLRNLMGIRTLRVEGLSKAPVSYRLFVQRISWHLGIKQPVKVLFSTLVQSPLTIGFIKPLILLPVVSFNHLSLQQAEAILLHELAHIRRSDFLVNLLVSLIQTFLYFNPFARLFVREAEFGREICCDELVVQFGYNRVAYAQALLQLEKANLPPTQLALAATGKHQLLARIEAIVGQPRLLPRFRMLHLSGLMAALLGIVAVHSLHVDGKKEGQTDSLHAWAQFTSPFSLAYDAQVTTTPADQSKKQISLKGHLPETVTANNNRRNTPPRPPLIIEEPLPAMPAAPEPPLAAIEASSQQSAMESLNAAEQAQVSATVAATQQVLSKLEWQELEQDMADGLSEKEKSKAYEQYQAAISKLNWQQLEQHLASRFHTTDWEAINGYLNGASRKMHLDSLSTAYQKALNELARVGNQPREGLVLPDLSTTDIYVITQQLKAALDSIETLRKRPVVRF